MKAESLTKGYTLSEQDGIYYLNFGVIKQNVPVTAKLRFTEVNSAKFNISKTCGCTTVENEAVNPTTFESVVKYDAAVKGNINKTVIITNGNKQTELKLTGQTTL